MGDVPRYRQLMKQLQSERQTWEPDWQGVIDYITPLRGRIGGDPASQTNRGGKSQSYVLDETASQDMGVLSSGLMTGVTSPARSWFALATPDKALNKWIPAKRWLEDVAESMADLFRRSNLYTVLPSVYKDLGGIGTSATGFYEDDEDVFRFYPYPVGSWYLAGNQRMTVDTFARDSALTVRQLVALFGKDNLSESTRAKLASGNLEQWVAITQLVMPNEAHDASKIGGRFKRWKSCWFEAASNEDKTLRESGFNEFPILAPRWDTDGEDVYGRGPGQSILPTVRALQVMERRKAQAIERIVDPPILAPANLASGEIDSRPGAVNYYDRNSPDGAQSVMPLFQVQINIQHLAEDIARKQAFIHRGLFTDLFLMLAMDARNQPPTAAEIYARQEEKLLVLGPVLERLNDELLDPLINRAFAIMSRRGLLPEPPEEMQGMPLSVEYVSVMAQAQKMVGLAAQERLIGHVGMLAQINPEVLDKIDFDAEVDEYAGKVGASAKLLRPQDQVMAMRQKRAEAAQAQQSLAAAQAVGKTARDLATAPLDTDNALVALAQRQ